jgi:hypothetical protein
MNPDDGKHGAPAKLLALPSLMGNGKIQSQKKGKGKSKVNAAGRPPIM